MPIPRRKIHALVTDANGTIPVYRDPATKPRKKRRCENPKCRAFLASDNQQPYCSPCQRRIGGDPDLVNVYHHIKPRR